MCGLNLSPCDLTSASSERPQGRWVVTGRYQRVIKRYQLQPLSPCVLTIRSAPLVAGNGTAAAAGVCPASGGPAAGRAGGGRRGQQPARRRFPSLSAGRCRCEADSRPGAAQRPLPPPLRARPARLRRTSGCGRSGRRALNAEVTRVRYSRRGENRESAWLGSHGGRLAA